MRKGKKKEGSNEQRKAEKQEEARRNTVRDPPTPPCRPLWPGTGNTIPGT
jgi:hypothetical protein